MSPPILEYRILALYRFVPIVTPSSADAGSVVSDGDGGCGESTSWDEATLMAHPERHPILRNLQSELLTTLRGYDVKGTLLIAPEGINGTICYPFPPPTATATAMGESDDPVANYLKNHPLFGGPELRTRLSVWKEEENGQQAFHRLKIKIKAEIVTLGLGRPLVDRKPVDCSQQDEGIASNDKEEHITNMDQITDSSAQQSPDSASTVTSTSNNAQSKRHKSNQLANPLTTKGHYLSPAQWDEACNDPDVLVIDTRNTYEIEIGTFKSAIDPKTQNFSDFPEYLERLAGEYDWSGYDGDHKQVADGDSHPACSSGTSAGNASGSNCNSNTESSEDCTKKKQPPKGIAMFCTGGIRCEKATSYAMQSNLFPKDLPIYHLEGGILAYLDDVAKRGGSGSNGEKHESANNWQSQQTGTSTSTFKGECFVFDKRVAVTDGLKPSTKYISCHGCRGPMDHRLLSTDEHGSNMAIDNVGNEEAERYKVLAAGIPNLPPLRYDPSTKRHYLPGLTCPRCHGTTTRESLERFAQREQQMEICAKQGKSHFEDRGVKAGSK